MDNKNMPAFPASADKFNASEMGLTKREYFAAMAMQGLLANYEAQKDMQQEGRYTGSNFAEVLALNSIEFADALLKELENTPSI